MSARVLVSWLVWWLVSAALWLALVDKVDARELWVGAAAAAIAATAAVLVRSQRDQVLRPRVRWLRRAWRPLLGLVVDLWPLTVALVRRGILRREETGALTTVPFEATGDDPEQFAHRVLTEALGSLAPNTLVVEIDRERGVLIAHELVPTGRVERNARPLGPRP
jgi:multisubunit Na+/H+ antiporter MnhE subunit